MTRILLTSLLLAAPLALGAAPTAEQLLQRYDAVMGPQNFETDSVMTATREDGSSRTYVMRMLRGDSDRFRIWFKEPASVKGQEMLRVGDNNWVYLPNLKRATRIANRDSFQGGDFNNADVLRVNYAADYQAKSAPTAEGEAWMLELKAKTPSAPYEAVKLWFRQSDLQPLRAQYFATSGQLLRSAEFSDHREFEKGYVRPAKVLMRNELVKSHSSSLELRSLKLNVKTPPQRFTQADLGR